MATILSSTERATSTDVDDSPTVPLLSGEQGDAATNYTGTQDRETIENPAVIENDKKTRVWALPWVIMIIALYLFVLPWVQQAIIDRYFLHPKWGAALPGLDRTPLRKFTMRGHMSTGAVSLLCGPFQFIPWVRKHAPSVHRWTGRLYATCAMLSCLFGLTFIFLKGRLVGDYNMTVAFSFAGLTIGILGYKVWQTARLAKTSSGPLDFTSHRNWGIRSYSQIMAPMLYRYWYVALQMFDLYKVPIPPRMGGYCRSDDICPDYLRWVDMVHCWTYWLTSLAVAELIIYYLPSATPESSSDEAPDAPSTEEGGEQTSSDDQPLLETTEDARSRERSYKLWTSSPSAVSVNVIGWSLAVITVAITGRVFTYSRD